MKLELLSPAKDLPTGIAAVQHGADAVYIGSPNFSARSTACNSLADIEKLVRFAHQYYARIYVALNTILKDEELAVAQKLIWQLYEIGVDAIIVQDMGILEMDLPNIELHASTQCDNRTLQKIQFLEKCGIKQVVLARELSLTQIADIKQHTNIRLESFIHGALCVCYSGQCYMSQAVSSRSANRGECSQMCRQKYTLTDSNGKIIAKNTHLLSLKDLYTADYIEKLIDAGVTSFKIEGRLKNIEYVKNTTAFYRQILDKIIDKNGWQMASSGKTKFNFVPDIEKTFFRGATSYFLENRTQNITEFRTPKSIGEKVGKIEKIEDNYLIINSKYKINNGDGLCTFDKNGELIGFRVNLAEGNKIFPQSMPKISTEAELFRNFDISFLKSMENHSATRKIYVQISVNQQDNALKFVLTDEDKNQTAYMLEIQMIESKNPEKLLQTYKETFSKLGNTIFQLSDIEFNTGKIWFIPISKIVEVKNLLIDKLLKIRELNFEKRTAHNEKTTHSYFTQSLDYHANIYNYKAKEFYQQHGVQHILPAFEQQPPKNAELMRTKHCLKYSFNLCPKQKPQTALSEPLFLLNEGKKFQLIFDCQNCEMVVIQ